MMAQQKQKFKNRSITTIKQFYESIKDDYPELSFEDVREICEAPFKMLRKVFESASLDTVRLKYFGKFHVRPARVKRCLTSLERSYADGEVDEDYYNKYKTIYQNFLNENS